MDQEQQMPALLTLTVQATLTFSPRLRIWKTSFKYDSIPVTNSVTGEPLGAVGVLIGGSLELHDETTEETWTLPVDVVWNAFQKALKDQQEAACSTSSDGK